jgi:plastocyanin
VVATAAAALAVLGTACGSGSDEGAAGGSAPDRVVEVAMVDTAFEPDRVEVAAGEVVRFVFTNEGEVRHEADPIVPAASTRRAPSRSAATNPATTKPACGWPSR